MCPSDFKWFSFKTKPWNALWGPKRLKCLVANGINPALAISWNPLGKMEMSNTDISNKQRCRRCPICGLLCSALLFSRLEAGALMIRQVFWSATRDATTSCSFMDLPHFSLPLHCSCINSFLARANTYSLQLAKKKGRTTPRISNVTTVVSTPIWNRLTRVKSAEGSTSCGIEVIAHIVVAPYGFTSSSSWSHSFPCGIVFVLLSNCFAGLLHNIT